MSIGIESDWGDGSGPALLPSDSSDDEEDNNDVPVSELAKDQWLGGIVKSIK